MFAPSKRRFNALSLQYAPFLNIQFDSTDRKIVALLRENARRSFKDIGGHVHLSAPAVKRRVDRLERDGEASAILHVMAEDTKDLELALERLRAVDGVTRTVTEVVLSTLFQR